MADNTDFTLNKDAYTTFDALSLKQLIKNRLNEGDIFTDQIFEGSNISAIIDIIAYSYHTLLFYLNQTSSETMFTETNIYENMNRIVKLIDYNPTGFLTSILPFKVSADENIPVNLYTFKRYSYFIVDGTYFSFRNDVTFNKNNVGFQELTEVSDNNVLFQGQYFENPALIAIGEDFETKTLVVKNNADDKPFLIDSNTLDVYVKDVNSNKFTFYSESSNIFLNNPEDTVYEKRLNENGFFEFKFGNGVFGKKLNAGDQIFIYYLKSDGEKGKISPNKLNGNELNFYTTPQFEQISLDIYDDDFFFLPVGNISNLSFTNDVGSSDAKERETVEEIRENSIKLLRSQNRLVTISDYESFINKNFSSVIGSVKVVNNLTYIKEYIKYFYDLGLDRPNDDSRFLFNQVKFSTSGQFNNLHFFMSPKINPVDNENNINFLSTSQKNSIFESMSENKMTNIEFMPGDPVYNAFSVGLPERGEKLSTTIIDETNLIIKRRLGERVSAQSLLQNVNNIFINYFKDRELGSVISLNDISNNIINLNGVGNIITRRTFKDGRIIESPGISLLSFNIIYDEVDINQITSDITMPFFKYPFLYNNTLENNLVVEDE